MNKNYTIVTSENMDAIWPKDGPRPATLEWKRFSDDKWIEGTEIRESFEENVNTKWGEYRIESPAMRSDFRVGDTVYTLIEGKGKVTDINKKLVYPISVKFETGAIESFTPEGKCFIEDKYNVCLFFSPPIPGDTEISETEPEPTKLLESGTIGDDYILHSIEYFTAIAKEHNLI